MGDLSIGMGGSSHKVLFRVLGPFEVEVGGRPFPLGRRRERCLLAVLLLELGCVMAVDRLVDLLWDEDPPEHARRAVHAHVARLRAALDDPLGGDGVRIVTAGSGYVLHAERSSVDAEQFRQMAGRARAGTAEERAGLLRAALALWRGPPLVDIASYRLRARVCRDLEELRLLAHEDCIAAELDLGRHAELVAELHGLTDAHPYRERLRALLMLALYRAGRQVEALEVFRSTRALLVDELGMEPTVRLQRLHQVMLHADERLARITEAELGQLADATVVRTRPWEVTRRIPRELPADVAGFTGRAEQLKALDELLPGDRGAAAVPVVISAIAGAAGAGKTALAVHWAHRVAERFHDGQLYVNLRGYALEAPVRPAQALAGLLRSLGVPPAQVPVEQVEAAALYRSLLAGRRVLVLLDNARFAEQVRPLLPGGPGGVVVITSRNRLCGLVARDGAGRLSIDVLSPAEASDLLVRVLGAARMQAEPDASEELASMCAHLPLALRIAAANLVDRPQLRIAEYVRQLREGNRLAALSTDGDKQASVSAAFDLSYRVVPAAAQRMFRMLGLAPGPDITVEAAAALAGVTDDEAVHLLDRLAATHLVTEYRLGRYTFHDLLRLYARDRASRDEPESERQVAIRRLHDWYVHSADAAVTVLGP